MVEKIVKTMAFMSMKSFLQSICCEMSPMVRGHATVYSSIEKLSDSLCPQGVILKGLLTERRQILFKNRRLFQWQWIFSLSQKKVFMMELLASTTLPQWVWLIAPGDLWLSADPGSYQTGHARVASATSVFVSGDSCFFSHVQFISLPLQVLCGWTLIEIAG